MRVELLNHQLEFLTAEEKFVLLLGGIGCIHDSALIETIDGPKHPSEIKKETLYKSFNGVDFVYSKGTAPFLKGKGDLYRVIHEQGEFVVFGSHLIFCEDSKYRRVDELFSSENLAFPSLFPTNLDDAQKVLFSNVNHCLKLIRDFLICYQEYTRFYGERPHQVLNIGKDIVLSLVDVLKFCQSFYLFLVERMDDQSEQALKHIHHENNASHASTKDFSLPSEGQLLDEVNRILTLLLEYILPESQSSEKYHKMNVFHRIDFLLTQHHKLFSFNTSPFSSKIIRVEKTVNDYYWDLYVENTHNYIANGTVHHNSGKSFIGAHYIIGRAIKYPKALHFVGANTYDQLRNATLATILNVLTATNIPFSYNQNQGLLIVGPGKILCKSMENFEMHRGIEIGSFWLDEVRDLKQEAFLVMMGRLRSKQVARLEGRLTTSPAGFNWLYDFFDPAGELHKSEFRQIKASSYDNVFLPEGYIDSLRSTYSDQFYKQEILADYVNLTEGKAYMNFGPHNLSDINPFASAGERLSRFLPIVVACDFNVTPMAWTLGQQRGDHIHWFDEIWLKNSDSQEASNELVGRVKDHKPGLVIVGDATGKALKTSSVGQTDYTILFNTLKNANIKYSDRTPDSNPLVKDRVNTVNSRLKSSSGEVNLTFNPKNCPHLKKDFERVVWKEGASAILDQTTDRDLTHSTDGIGYAHCVLTPIHGLNDVGRLYILKR